MVAESVLAPGGVRVLEIRLVGTVEAVVAGEVVALPGRRVRSLLALLALSPGETVSTDSLAVGIWDDDPPANVRGSLHTYVGRLRRLLGDETIETRPTGYALLVPRSAVDLLGHWDSAQTARDDSDPANERAALTTALEGWHADLFGDAPSEWLARHERSVWVERRLQLFERWVDLSFGDGDHQRCLEELSRQVEAYPLREPLWVRLLTALDRVGRTADALDRYETVRKRLAEELGVDPSPELRAVYVRLLARSDEDAGETIRATPVIVPHQLPVQVRGFVGREAQLAAMDRVLAQGDGEHGGALLALHGPAGSGKTTAAVHWAHRVKDRFPDGQLFIDLQGYGPGEPMSPDRALTVLLRGLGVPGEGIPADVDERSAMLRSESEGRRLLVVLDNARESDQVRPLLPGSDALVLVTSRTQLRGLAAREAAHRVRVDQMPADDSVAMLRRRLGDEVTERDVLELAELCGHLPVALSVAAERAGRGGTDAYPVRALIAELRDHKGRLSALDSGDDDPLTNVRAVLDWSYRSLDDESARVLRLLGLHTAPLISTGAVAALAGVEPDGVTRAIDRLTDRHLLTPNLNGYHATHDLVRDFAAAVAADEEPESERAAAVRRLRGFFLHSTARARIAWTPRSATRISLPDLPAGINVEDFASAQAGFAWLDAHAEHLRNLIDVCVSEGDPVGYQLAPLLFGYYQNIGMAGIVLTMLQRSEESARRLGDGAGQASCANSVGVCHFEREENVEALAAVARARDLFETAGDVHGALRAQGNLAVALGELGRNDEAAAAFARAIADARRLGVPTRLGWHLFNASDFYLSIGDLDAAMASGEEAVEILEAVNEPTALASAVDNLGDVQAAAGDLAGAIESMHSALDAYRTLHMRRDETSALRKLGLFHRDLGDRDAARTYWVTAQRLLADTGISGVKKINRSELDDLIASLDDPADE